MKLNNIILDWLNQHGDPEIDKFVKENLEKTIKIDMKTKVYSAFPSVGKTPTELEPVLAKITSQTDLGSQHWYEVVYWADGEWSSYAGSRTFRDGEKVLDWVACDSIFRQAQLLASLKDWETWKAWKNGDPT